MRDRVRVMRNTVSERCNMRSAPCNTSRLLPKRSTVERGRGDVSKREREKERIHIHYYGYIYGEDR